MLLIIKYLFVEKNKKFKHKLTKKEKIIKNKNSCRKQIIFLQKNKKFSTEKEKRSFYAAFTSGFPVRPIKTSITLGI